MSEQTGWEKRRWTASCFSSLPSCGSRGRGDGLVGIDFSSPAEVALVPTFISIISVWTQEVTLSVDVPVFINMWSVFMGFLTWWGCVQHSAFFVCLFFQSELEQEELKLLRSSEAAG